MTNLPGIDRAKLVVASYGPALGVTLLVVGALALGSAGWIYTHPPTTTVTDHTDRQAFESTLHTSAIVTGQSSLYRNGTRLEDQHLYLLPAAPNVTLTVRTTVPEGETVRLTHRLELVTQATNDGTVFWERSRVLREQQMTTSDGSLNTSATLDVPELQDRLVPISNEIGPGSSLGMFVRVTTSYETSRYSGTMSDTTSLQLSRKTYSVGPVTLRTTESTRRDRRIALPSRDESAYLLPGGLGAVALLLAGAIGITHRRLPRRGVLAYHVHRTRYAEWISTGSLPPSMDGQRIEVESLEDLVGIAIDTKKRVLFDADQGVYAVLDGRIAYFYGDWSQQSDPDFEWPSENNQQR